MENKKYIKQMQKQIIELKKHNVFLAKIYNAERTENVKNKKYIKELENKFEVKELEKKVLITLLFREVSK